MASLAIVKKNNSGVAVDIVGMICHVVDIDLNGDNHEIHYHHCPDLRFAHAGNYRSRYTHQIAPDCQRRNVQYY